MKVNGKVIVVTGAGSGIGRAVALELLARGAAGVAAVDINADVLAETVTLAGANIGKVSTHVANLADRASVAALPQAVIAKHGQVDGYANVAGIIQHFVKIEKLDYAEFEKVMNVNFWGTVAMYKEFIPVLLARPEAQILNVSSMGAYAPVPGQTAYGATKAAVRLFTEGVRGELAGTNVGATVVFPGATATNIAGNSGAVTEAESKAMAADAPKFKMNSPEHAAAQIVDAFEKNKFNATIGSDATLMYRLVRLMPQKAAEIIQKQMASLLK
jgi:NAD(P)-dependent dehydrogenase (short-subunit alcohol dehydrogenase family)